MHAFPSLHAVPFALAGLEHAPVAGLHAPAEWHWSLAVQVTGLDPVHVPDWQVSVCVHRFPSSHAVPFGFTGFEHVPVAVLHVPGRWHWSLAVQVTGLDPVHVPDWQVSVCVQGFPSSQIVPFAFAGLEHAPVAGSHAPAEWHESLAVQETGFDPVHVPDWQVSVWVQAFPSLHDEPFALGGLEQEPVAGLQAPASWHWSLAVQVIPFDPVHVPDWQVSDCVHGLPSSQVVPFGFAGFEHTPVVVSHVPGRWH